MKDDEFFGKLDIWLEENHIVVTIESDMKDEVLTRSKEFVSHEKAERIIFVPCLDRNNIDHIIKEYDPLFYGFVDERICMSVDL
jgi:hypothetical protein